MDPNDNPTPPAEGASGAQDSEQGGKKDEASGADARPRPSVNELLAAARGDVAARAKSAPKTPVTPSARAASEGTEGVAAPAGDAPGKEVPAATPQAARAVPASGASKVTSTPTPSVNKGVAKPVAARPPAGPVVQSAPDPPINKLRRRIVWASVAGLSGSLDCP